MILEVLGYTLVGGALTGLLFTKRSEQKQIRKQLEGMIIGEKIIHRCVADGHEITSYPTVEYVIPKDYGYRVLIHMPDSVTIEDFKRREEAFEYRVGYPVVLQSKGDVLFMDIIKEEGKIFIPPVNFQEFNRERVSASANNRI